jgi:hypothetical protein
MHDDLDHAQIAADQEFARAFTAGDVELAYDGAAPVPELPPVGAPSPWSGRSGCRTTSTPP